MLKEALVHALERGMKRVLIACNQGNTGSEKVIIRNGGKLENIIDDGDEMVARYWIKRSSD